MAPRSPRSGVRAGLAALAALATIATAWSPPPALALDPPELPAEAIRIIESLDGLEPQTVQLDTEAPCCSVDAGAPAVIIPAAIRELEALRRLAPPRERPWLNAASSGLRDAWAAFTGGDRRHRGDPSSLHHLRRTIAGLHRSVGALGASGRRTGNARSIEAAITRAAGRIAEDVHAVAVGAGVSPRRLGASAGLLALARRTEDAGRSVAAVALYDAALGFAAGTITFDLDAFEQNIRDAIDGQAIGYTYAISVFDTVARSDGIGDARIPPDGSPATQSETREMHLASVSKPLTAGLVLWLLEQNGLTPDDPIGPWLPDAWTPGAGVAAQTFRDFLTHRTGFTQKGIAKTAIPTYANLQAAIAIPVPANTAYDYNNSNFALFRVIVPALAGFDLDAYPAYDEDELAAGLFVYAALSFYEAVGAHATCHPDQPNRTLYYSQPHNGTNGLATIDYSLECGGYGFYMASDDLGAVLGGLAATDDLLSDASWDLMRQGQLGFMDPADGWFWGNGGLGLYHNHGGDWASGIKGLDACVMLYPTGVSAALQINSIGGGYAYQCEVLRAAFDGAWSPT